MIGERLVVVHGCANVSLGGKDARVVHGCANAPYAMT
jgi:hypothetical protein